MMFQASALFIVFKLLAHVESVSIKKAAISSLALNPLALNGLQITPASNGLISYHHGHSPVGMNPLAGMPSLQDLEVSISKTLNKNKKKISPKKLNRVNAAELHQLTTMKTDSLKKKFAELTGGDLESQSIFNRIVDQVQERYERTCLLKGKKSAIGKRDVGNTLASSCATGNILVDTPKELVLLLERSDIKLPSLSRISKFFARENSKVVALTQEAQMTLNPKQVLSALKTLPDKYWKIVVSRLGYEVNGPKDLKEHENSITELYESYCVKKQRLMKRAVLDDVESFCRPIAEALEEAAVVDEHSQSSTEASLGHNHDNDIHQTHSNTDDHDFYGADDDSIEEPYFRHHHRTHRESPYFRDHQETYGTGDANNNEPHFREHQESPYFRTHQETYGGGDPNNNDPYFPEHHNEPYYRDYHDSHVVLDEALREIFMGARRPMAGTVLYSLLRLILPKPGPMSGRR